MKTPRIVPLDAPRPLTPEEQVLLEHLLTSPLANDEVRAQARTAEVVGMCDCGCRSVGLRNDEGSPRAPGSADVVQITAHGRAADGTFVEVTLHVIHGRIAELEIWDGTFDETHGAMPDPETLQLDGNDE
jgi:Domain of unknown function (DUF6984)